VSASVLARADADTSIRSSGLPFGRCIDRVLGKCAD
jgi:hypothetical protein